MAPFLEPLDDHAMDEQGLEEAQIGGLIAAPHPAGRRKDPAHLTYQPAEGLGDVVDFDELGSPSGLDSGHSLTEFSKPLSYLHVIGLPVGPGLVGAVKVFTGSAFQSRIRGHKDLHLRTGFGTSQGCAETLPDHLGVQQ